MQVGDEVVIRGEITSIHNDEITVAIKKRTLWFHSDCVDEVIPRAIQKDDRVQWHYPNFNDNLHKGKVLEVFENEAWVKWDTIDRPQIMKLTNLKRI